MRGSCPLDSVNESIVKPSHVFLAPAFSTIRSSVRKRKRRDSDSYSVCSLDLSLTDSCKKSRLPKVSSLVSLISPARPMRKFGNSIQKSLSGIHISSPKAVLRPRYDENCEPDDAFRYKGKSVSNVSLSLSSTCKFPRTSAKLWVESISSDKLMQLRKVLSKREFRRQEAIFELYQGEIIMMEDLHLVTKLYRDSLLHLGILSNAELKQIFGTLHMLLPVHQELSSHFTSLQSEDMLIKEVGDLIINWVPKLSAYTEYCSNLMNAKELLDVKKRQDPRLQEFLQRCLESPFSRKLDLWSFLDVPRNRLVKYPLLLRNILKLTPDGHPDIETLPCAIKNVEIIINDVDRVYGERQCQFYVQKLYHINEEQLIPELKATRRLICSGVLRNNRGTKLDTFLFDTVLVMSRPVLNTKQTAGKSYQIYRQPIPVSQLVVEVLNDGEVKMGSFKATFTSHQISKNLFKVVDKSGTKSHTLQAGSEHDKKQWLNSFQQLSVGIVFPSDSFKLSSTDNFFSTQTLLRPRNRNSVPVMSSSKKSQTLGRIVTRELADPDAVILSSKSIYI